MTVRQCDRCKQQFSQLSIHAIAVTIDGGDGLNGTKFNFCCVECAAIRFNELAGGIMMPDLDHERCQDIKW